MKDSAFIIVNKNGIARLVKGGNRHSRGRTRPRLNAGAVVRNLGDVRWCATEDGSAGKGTGRHIAAFILDPPSRRSPND